MPEATRPKLLLFGESLGSYGTEQAFGNVDEMISGVDGALLVGPVFRNHIHNEVTDAREPGSPFWRPVYQQGEHVRFAVAPSDLVAADDRRGSRRGSSTCRTRATRSRTGASDLIWNRPEWLDQPRGPDVSDDMFWVPAVTFWSTLGDMVFSTAVPAGHGHSYGANPVDAWAAITSPPGWTPEKTQRLREIVADK